MKALTLAAVLLASCAPSPPAALPEAPPQPTVSREEVLRILGSIETDFYRHWGAVEKTALYASLRPAHVPVLREIADANGELALVACRVLRHLAPGERFTDGARAILYATAFSRETNFARWGTLSRRGILPAVYGDEMIALGAAVVSPLRKSLLDRRRARVQGGAEEERANRVQGDRACDYAWVILATILDRPFDYTPDEERRDPQIREFDLWLDRRR